MHPLDISLSRPLEREYEAWIISGIENYFSSLGIKVAIWAVSPSEEVYWPADEKILIGGKLIGLQLKKVEYKNRGNPIKDYGKLTWQFHSPPGQFELVIKHPEIFYCLPTFVNRRYKEQALSHCLFWRPQVRGKYEKNAWYNHPNAKTIHNAIGDAARWGYFIEQAINCDIGKKVGSVESAKDYLRSIRGFVKAPAVDNENELSPDEAEQIDIQPLEQPLYMIALPSSILP